jgi:aspartate carbamoyltransferase catalytic subunit
VAVTSRLRNVIESQQFSRSLLEDLYERADEMKREPHRFMGRLAGQVMAALFYEPSTRTRLSFEAAMLRLGGQTMGTDNAREFSSAAKGETLEDTIRIVSGYADVIVLRHSEEGAARRAASVSTVPIVNAGDGPGQHPTQALLDLYTIREEIGRLDGLHVAIVGDVLHSRVARSLLQAFALVGIRATLVGPPALLPRELPAETSMDIEAIRDADVVYVLRMQNERMEAGANFVPSLREYTARWGITPERLRPGQKVMHPGPMNRGVEIDPRVADSPDSLITKQVRSGLVVRMAVLYDVLTGGPVGVQALTAVEVA